MKVIQSPSRACSVAVLEGPLDGASADAVQSQLMGILLPYGLIVDMTNVRYVSSAGLRALFALRQIAEERSVAFTLVGIHGAVRELFELAGVGEVIAYTLAEPPKADLPSSVGASASLPQ